MAEEANLVITKIAVMKLVGKAKLTCFTVQS